MTTENENISVAEVHSRFSNRRIFTIDFFGDHFTTTVTSTPSVVRKWIRTTWLFNRRHRHHLVVGLGVQWNPYTNNSDPAGTLQLCVGRRCLILQLSQADSVPKVLRRFLNDDNATFVGIWNNSDEDRLMRSEHALSLSSEPIDLRHDVAKKLDEPALAQAGMGTLVKRFFGYEGVAKDNVVSMSDWNAYRLTHKQVLYASVDVYVAFQMGKNMCLGSR